MSYLSRRDWTECGSMSNYPIAVEEAVDVNRFEMILEEFRDSLLEQGGREEEEAVDGGEEEEAVDGVEDICVGFFFFNLKKKTDERRFF